MRVSMAVFAGHLKRGRQEPYNSDGFRFVHHAFDTNNALIAVDFADSSARIRRKLVVERIDTGSKGLCEYGEKFAGRQLESINIRSPLAFHYRKSLDPMRMFGGELRRAALRRRLTPLA